MKAAIVGIAGPVLRPEEAALLADCRPAGVILFARNVEDRRQLAALRAALGQVLPPEAVLMVDQDAPAFWQRPRRMTIGGSHFWRAVARQPGARYHWAQASEEAMRPPIGTAAGHSRSHGDIALRER